MSAIDKTIVKAIACGGGGGEPVAIDKKDGKIVRIRPHHWDWKYTEEELEGRLWEFESHGKKLKTPLKAQPPYYAMAYKRRAYSKDRVKYPLKRVDWEPGGDPEKINAHNRGISKYKPISWDEAIQIMHDEIQRIYDTYGPSGVCCIGENGHKESKGIHYGGGCHMRLMRLLGGHTREVRTPDSVEGYYWGGKHTWGTGSYQGMGMVECYENIVKDVADNTQLIMLQSGDWETMQNYNTQSWSQILKFWLDLGIKCISVDPFCSYTNVCHDNVKWVPIIPNTDVAFDFALMYVWITEDLYDKEYLETHSVGFDKVKAYVLGEDEEGIAKTPAWASEITGIPEYTIKAIARKWGREVTSIGHFCGTFIRGPYSHEPGRTEYYKFAMQGIGKPGVHQIHLFSFVTARYVNNKGENLLGRGGTMSFTEPQGHTDTYVPNPFTIPRTLIAEAIEKGHCEWWGSPSIILAPREDQFIKREYPNVEAGGTEFHMLWSEKASNMNSWNGGFYLQQALRNPKVEFFVSNHQWLQGDSIFADLILPITTCLEDMDCNCGTGLNNSVYWYGLQDPCMDPVGEPKSDYEVALLIAKSFGIEEQLNRGMTLEEEMRYQFATSQIADDITYEELYEKGYYVPKLRENWQDAPSGMYNFYKDPANNPIQTPSGLIELWSDDLATVFPDDKERQPMAKWIPGGPKEEGWIYDETLSGEKAKKYPLVIAANPARWRIHGQNDDITWFREIPTCKVMGKDGYMYEPLWLCPEEAEKRGIVDGDILKVYNDEGIVLAAARISERCMPNMCMIGKGAHPDPIAPRIDRGGCINLICPPDFISKHCAGFVVTGYLVEVEKLEDAEMDAWRAEYPESFARAYDPASGSSYAGWVEGVE